MYTSAVARVANWVLVILEGFTCFHLMCYSELYTISLSLALVSSSCLHNIKACGIKSNIFCLSFGLWLYRSKTGCSDVSALVTWKDSCRGIPS